MNWKFCLTTVIIFLFCLFSCGEKQDYHHDAQDLSSGTYFYFLPGTDQIFQGVQPVEIQGIIDRKNLIEKLGDHLATTYFAQANSSRTNIRFELVSLQSIHVRERPYYIANINMVDEEEAGIQYFFQGSFGGQVTFAMIAATFLQLQNKPPLLDGLIFNYNGNAFPQLDHIHFKGIITPRAVESVVFSAIQDSKSKGLEQKKNSPSD